MSYNSTEPLSEKDVRWAKEIRQELHDLGFHSIARFLGDEIEERGVRLPPHLAFTEEARKRVA